MNKPILISNSWPLALIRRKVIITPCNINAVAQTAQYCGVVSAWGHPDTVLEVSALLGVDITPMTPRPSITLTDDGLPTMDGHVWWRVYVISPQLAGRDTTQIAGWYGLMITYPRQLRGRKLK